MRLRCIICLQVLVGLLILPMRAAPEEDTLKLIARGGHISGGLFPSAPCDDETIYNIAYSRLMLTIQVENLSEAVHIEGVIAHPYGEGPFEAIIPGDSLLIVSSEIVTEGTYISFTMELAAPDSPQSLTLFTAKPDMCVDRSDALGAAFDYPYPVEWIAFSVTDTSGAPIAVSTHTDPVSSSTDLLMSFRVFVEGFSAPVSELWLIELNGRELYPPWELTPVFSFSGQFIGYGLYGMSRTSTVGIPELPMVFEVVLEDGQRYRIPVQETSELVYLTPASAVAHWEWY